MFKFLVAALACACLVQDISAMPRQERLDIDEIIGQLTEIIASIRARIEDIAAVAKEEYEKLVQAIESVKQELEEIKEKLENVDPECKAKVDVLISELEALLDGILACGADQLQQAGEIVSEVVATVVDVNNIVLGLYLEYQVCQAILPEGREPTLIEQARYAACIAALAPKVVSGAEKVQTELSEEYESAREAIARLTEGIQSCNKQEVILQLVSEIREQALVCIDEASPSTPEPTTPAPTTPAPTTPEPTTPAPTTPAPTTPAPTITEPTTPAPQHQRQQHQHQQHQKVQLL